MTKIRIAEVFYDTETKKFGASYFGFVAEQGGLREGWDQYQTKGLSECLTYLKSLMTASRTNEEFYFKHIEDYLNQKGNIKND